jgi:RNA polymerase sigma factor (sigma-70 family)
MRMPVDVSFRRQAEQCYSDGYTFHGDLDLKLDEYEIHVGAIVQKHIALGSTADSACCFLKGLCTTDLYLSAACTKVSERAWNRFTVIYKQPILDFARSTCHNRDSASEVADAVLANMFLPDNSGRRRIASYDGRSPLHSWLRVTVFNCATRERERKCNTLENIDCLDHLPDASALVVLERRLRASKYGPIILEAFAFAGGSLTTLERSILLLRYEEELQVTQIARVLQVNPSSITRRIESIQRKLRDGVISTLDRKGLAKPAIRECTAEILENSVYSVLGFVRKASEV